ncbi:MULTISPECIES: DUF4192 domain-containing protein [Actinoplanes]|uniref:DUF4192 domain-containing protein n=1 Tax=Actinoplanes TaxID=1865 RepID=UPI0005F29767|nr:MULTISPECIES: DUF4192 domain-containing protein [Actinoplanes]GLY04916.1 hypothetical protein Acsp01_52950 [Actinoplanes sp. NBRC 101535]
MRTERALALRTPSDLVAALPFLLGYHPADAMVVVGVTGLNLDFGACYDLTAPAATTRTAEFVEAVAVQGSQTVILIGYGPADRITTAIAVLGEALRSAGLFVEDAIRVTGGRWWSYVCREPRCCPPEGTPCLPADSVIAAEATYRGSVALPSRRDLVAQVSRLDGPVRVAMVAATDRARQRLTDLAAADLGAGRHGRMIRQAGRDAIRAAERRYRDGGTLDPDETAWLGMLLVDVRTEDFALDRCDGEDWRIRLWTDVLRRVEPVYVPGPACLLAYAAWRSGHGALARVALDRGLAENPDHRLASMLHELLGFAVPPRMLISTEVRARPRRPRRRRTGQGRSVS